MTRSVLVDQLIPENVHHPTAELGNPMQVSLDLLKKSGDETGLAFTGYSEPYADGLDCVAIFDGMSWTLQLLSGALKVQ